MKKKILTRKNQNNFFKLCIDKLKKLSFKNYLNIFLLTVILICETYVFFQYKMIFFPDGQLYYSLSRIIVGSTSLSHWSAVRGFGFPLIIAIWTKLFGDSSFGLILGSFIFYLFLILGIGFLIQKFIKINKVKNRSLFFFLYLLIVAFNPLIIGYQHTLLTEAVMPSFYLLTIMLCLKWYKINYNDNKKTYIAINIIFVILAIWIWFIKQPYSPAFYIALLLTAVLTAIYYKSWKIFATRMITVVMCFCFMMLSIFIWDNTLTKNSAASASALDVAYMSNNIYGGLSVYYYYVKPENFCDIDYIQSLDLSLKEKEKINSIYEQDKENWCSHIVMYELKDRYKQHIATEVIISNDDKIDMAENTIFLLKNIWRHPTLVLKSYFYNYLAIADIQERDLNRGVVSSLNYEPYVWGENLSNGMMALTIDNNTVVFNNKSLAKFNEKTTPSNIDLMNILLIHNNLCYYLYKLLIFLALPIFMYSFIKFIKNKNINYFLISICSLTTFVDAFFHVFTGHVIDRYAYPVYPLMILVLILLFMEKNNEDTKK